MFDIDNSASFATEENLHRAIFKRLGTVNYIVVRNRAGRWTAVFGYSMNNDERGNPLPAIIIASNGFKVIN